MLTNEVGKPVRPVYVNSSLSVPSSVNGAQPYHLLSDTVDLRDEVVVLVCMCVHALLGIDPRASPKANAGPLTYTLSITEVVCVCACVPMCACTCVHVCVHFAGASP